jgi:hypothetical protein
MICVKPLGGRPISNSEFCHAHAREGSSPSRHRGSCFVIPAHKPPPERRLRAGHWCVVSLSLFAQNGARLQFLPQRLGVLQVGGVEALGEPAVEVNPNRRSIEVSRERPGRWRTGRRHDRLGHRNARTHSSNPNAAGLFCSHATWASASGFLSVPFSIMMMYRSVSLLIGCLQCLQSMTSGILRAP